MQFGVGGPVKKICCCQIKKTVVYIYEGIRVAMITMVENEHGDRSSNYGRDCLHFS